jgi:hypothetical protein
MLDRVQELKAYLKAQQGLMCKRHTTIERKLRLPLTKLFASSCRIRKTTKTLASCGGESAISRTKTARIVMMKQHGSHITAPPKL